MILHPVHDVRDGIFGFRGSVAGAPQGLHHEGRIQESGIDTNKEGAEGRAVNAEVDSDKDGSVLFHHGTGRFSALLHGCSWIGTKFLIRCAGAVAHALGAFAPGALFERLAGLWWGNGLFIGVVVVVVVVVH